MTPHLLPKDMWVSDDNQVISQPNALQKGVKELDPYTGGWKISGGQWHQVL
jgi:hypothetical protein